MSHRKSGRTDRRKHGSPHDTGQGDLLPHESPRRPHRKTLQLCAQIQRTLEYVLSGEMDDDVLRGLMVQQVRPAPDASRLLVTVMPLDDDVSAEVILRKLALSSGRLRTEVARSINRSKTPQLAFEVFIPDRKTDENRG